MLDADEWVEQRWPRTTHTTLVEKSANGAAIVDTLKRHLGGVIAITVTDNKITRAINTQPWLEGGNIYLPGSAAPDTATGYHAPDWVANFIEEAATFPNGTNDDQVDAFSQAINWAHNKTSTARNGSFYAKGEMPIEPYVSGLASPYIIDPNAHYS